MSRHTSAFTAPSSVSPTLRLSLCVHPQLRVFACLQAELLDRLTENMTVPQLKEELRERNMQDSGRKSELKQRLTGNEQPES